MRCLRHPTHANNFDASKTVVSTADVSAECGAKEVPHPVGERQARGATDHDAQYSAAHVAAADAGAECPRKTQSHQHGNERHRHPPRDRWQQNRQQRKQRASDERGGRRCRGLPRIGQVLRIDVELGERFLSELLRLAYHVV